MIGTSRKSLKHSIVPACLTCAFGSIVAFIGSILIRSSIQIEFYEFKKKNTKYLFLPGSNSPF
jgi:hypothetical protein